MRLVRCQTLVDHRDANLGHELFEAARVLARSLGGDSLPAAQVPRQTHDDLDGLVAPNDVGELGEVRQIGSAGQRHDRHREDAVRVAPADADTHGADVHADTDSPANAHRASISERIASSAAGMPSGFVPPP